MKSLDEFRMNSSISDLRAARAAAIGQVRAAAPQGSFQKTPGRYSDQQDVSTFLASTTVVDASSYLELEQVLSRFAAWCHEVPHCRPLPNKIVAEMVVMALGDPRAIRRLREGGRRKALVGLTWRADKGVV